MLGKLKRIFLPLCVTFLILVSSIAKASVVLICHDGKSNQQSPAHCQRVSPVNTISVSAISLVGAGNNFSGDLYTTDPNGPLVRLPFNKTKMNSALGIEGSFLHMFNSFWIAGLSVDWSPLRLNLTPTPTSSPNLAAYYFGQMTMTQVAGNFLLGRRIYTSHFIKLRALLSLGLLYYNVTNAWVSANTRIMNFFPRDGFGVLYGAKLEAILGGWPQRIHPILSISYVRSSQLTLATKQGAVNSTRAYPLLNRPKFTESILMFGIGAAFMM